MLADSLNDIIDNQDEKSIETLSGYIVGELLGDLDNKYVGLIEKHPNVSRIADLSADLELSNGSQSELDDMWQELKYLIRQLSTEG